jgi:hypothetical protein
LTGARARAHNRIVLARYDIRSETEGWTVFDIWTGRPVVIDGVLMAGLEVDYAEDMAELLTRRAREGLREILQ